MTRLVRHIRPKLRSHDAVPRRAVAGVELLLYIRCYVLFYIPLVDGLQWGTERKMRE